MRVAPFLLVVLVVAGACSVPTDDRGGLPAQPVVAAGRQDARDDDTPLDIRRVRAKVTPKAYSITVVTYETWGDVAVRPGRGGILMYLNTTEDGEFNRYLEVAYDRSLYCRMHERDGAPLERVEVDRPTQRSVRCIVPRALVPGDSSRFRWSASTNFPARYGGRTWDYAPDAGYFERD